MGDVAGETFGGTEPIPAGGLIGNAIGDRCVGTIVGVDSGVSIGDCKG